MNQPVPGGGSLSVFSMPSKASASGVKPPPTKGVRPQTVPKEFIYQPYPAPKAAGGPPVKPLPAKKGQAVPAKTLPAKKGQRPPLSALVAKKP